MSPVPAKAPVSQPANHRTILIRGVNWLGDAVMTTPALVRLRERFPESSITLLTPEKLGDLWWQHPAIDEVLIFTPEESALGVSRRLRARRFDLGVILPNSFRSALELWLGRVSRRVGYAGNGRSWLLTQASPRPPGEIRMKKRSPGEIAALLDQAPSARAIPSTAHQIHQYLHLVGQIGASTDILAPCLKVNEAEINQFHQEFLKPLGLEPRSHSLVLGLNPGAEYGPAKRWPAERFAAVAAELHRVRSCCWIVFGGPQDTALADSICQQIRKADTAGPTPGAVVNLAGQTTLRELMAGLSLCDALLTNDSGPMHVAAALGTPVVVPFGSTSSALTGPGKPGDSAHRLLQSPVPVPCSPCFRRECPVDFRCMNQISVEQVTQALMEVTASRHAGKMN